MCYINKFNFKSDRGRNTGPEPEHRGPGAESSPGGCSPDSATPQDTNNLSALQILTDRV